MRKLQMTLGAGILIALISFPLFGLYGTDQEEQLQAAIKTAKEQGKPVLIDFYTTWCPPCKRFDRESKSDKQLKQAVEEVILVKIDCEKGKGVKLAKDYWIDRYPTFMLMNGKGDVVAQWTGYQKYQFLKELGKGREIIEDMKGD